jgi:peptidylprolyl isomerase
MWVSVGSKPQLLSPYIVTPQFDISIDCRDVGRIVFRLFDDVTPITARNFRELATGQHGYGFAGSPIHRIIPDVRRSSASLFEEN